MFTTEVFPPTEDQPFTTIYYRDERDIATVCTLVDSNGKLVQQEISEYDDKGKIQSCAIYDSDGHTLLAYREYDYNEEREIGYRDYRVIDGQPQFLVRTRTHWVIKDKLAHCFYYNEDNHPFAYEVFEDEDDGCGMVTMGRFDMSGQPFPIFDIPLYKRSF